MTFPRVVLPDLPKPRVSVSSVKTISSVDRLKNLTAPVSKFQQNISNLSSTGFVGTLPSTTAISYTENVLRQSVSDITSIIRQTLTGFAKAAGGVVTSIKKISSDTFNALSQSSVSLNSRVETQIESLSKIATEQNDIVQINGFILTPAAQKTATLKPAELKRLLSGASIDDSLVQQTIDQTVAGVVSTRFNPKGLTAQLQSLNKLST